MFNRGCMNRQLSSDEILQLNSFLNELSQKKLPEDLMSKARMIKTFIRNTIQNRSPQGMEEVGIIISATLIRIFKEKDYQDKEMIKTLSKTLAVITEIFLD